MKNYVYIVSIYIDNQSVINKIFSSRIKCLNYLENSMGETFNTICEYNIIEDVVQLQDGFRLYSGSVVNVLDGVEYKFTINKIGVL